MNIETIDDLCNDLADKLGVYGCCKSQVENDGKCTNDDPLCCRTGFMIVMRDRIINAVENERKLNQLEIL